MTWLDDAWTWVRNAAHNVEADGMIWSANAVRDAVDALESWVGGFSPVDFILVVLIAGAIYWLSSALCGSSRLGPIQVKPIEHDVTDGQPGAPATNALTALLRERLARSGLLPPPEVPAGSPQTNLIDAVEATGQETSAFVAALLKVMPQPPAPPSYTLTATLCGPSPCIRYWLQPNNNGAAHVGCVEGGDVEDAVHRVAAEVFMTLSHAAVNVFPSWSRWRSVDDLIEYLDAIQHRVLERFEEAYYGLLAITMNPSKPANPLARLQLANLWESGRCPPLADDIYRTQPATPVEMQAMALRTYLDIGFERPHLVAARYRAGSLAGMLASGPGTFQRLERAAIVRTGVVAEGVSDDELRQALQERAKLETKAAWRLLGWSHVLRSEFRVRHCYEPRGQERRELRRTVAISRITSRLRRVMKERKPFRVGLLRARVRFLLAPPRRPTTGWNAHYNAACFYALLHQRSCERARAGETLEAKRRKLRAKLRARLRDLRAKLRAMREPPATANDDPGQTAAPSPDDEVLGWRSISAIRRRAYEELGIAVEKAGEELERTWWSKRDPDLKTLRDYETDWNRFTARHVGTPGARGVLMPDSVRGEPNRRRNLWAVITVGTVALALFVDRALSWPAVMGAALYGLAAIALWRTLHLRRQARDANARAQPSGGSG